MQKLIFISLMVISLFITSCGNEEDYSSIPINTSINMNGFLDNFRGGKIELKIFHDSENSCSKFLDVNTPVDEAEEKLINFEIPEGNDDIKLSEENITIKPGVKTIYAILFDKNGVKSGHDCQKAVKCSLAGEPGLPDEAYEIKAGDKACVYLNIVLIP